LLVVAGQVVEWVEGETRVCSTLLCDESNSATEIIEPSAHISEAEVQGLTEKLEEAMETVKSIAICGTCPPGQRSKYFPLYNRA
jgi:fructose-1-phosphate kinase PfkB-like protein